MNSKSKLNKIFQIFLTAGLILGIPAEQAQAFLLLLAPPARVVVVSTRFSLTNTNISNTQMNGELALTLDFNTNRQSAAFTQPFSMQTYASASAGNFFFITSCRLSTPTEIAGLLGARYFVPR